VYLPPPPVYYSPPPAYYAPPPGISIVIRWPAQPESWEMTWTWPDSYQF
jgi:hypothetical protein